MSLGLRRVGFDARVGNRRADREVIDALVARAGEADELMHRVVEEAAEVWMAAEYESKEAAAEEISQLLYHLQVLMIAKGITLDDVNAHL